MSWIRDIKALIKSLIESRLSRVHTTIPAQVVSYDATTNTCSIQPCVKIFRSDDIESGNIELPQLDDIPVQFAGSGNVFLTCPVQADSYGMYHVAEEDINQWLSSGGIVSPSSVDRFNLDTGFFVPTAPWIFDSSFGAVAADRFSIRTRDGNTEVSVLDDGTVLINSPSGDTINITGGNVVVHGSGDAASLASIVDDYFSKIDAVFRTSWAVAPQDGGAALKAAYLGSFVNPPGTTASAKLKVDS